MIDSSIYGGIKPVAQEGPIDQYAKVATLKQLMGGNQLQDLQRQKLTDDLQEYGDFKAGLKALVPGETEDARDARLIGIAPKLGMENKKSRIDILKSQQEVDLKRQEIYDKKLTSHRTMVDSIKSPEDAVGWLKAAYTDPVLGPEFARLGPFEAAVKSIPQDPEGLKQWVQQKALGAAEFIKQNKPNVHVQNTGNASNIVAVPGLGGAPTTLSSTPIQQTPDSVASNATSRENALRVDARARERLAFDQAQPKGVVQQTQDGTFLVDPRNATAQPVIGQDGKQLTGKPMKDIPQSVLSGMIENNRALNKVTQAIAAVSGKQDELPEGVTADKNATGFKGYLPNAVINRVDPKGTDTRALIADIGSLKIHDRSGAAVTASESPRLMPFVPLTTDDDVTVAKKLKNFEREYKLMQQETGDYYSAENGFKPYKPAAPVAAQSSAKPEAKPDAGKPAAQAKLKPAAGTVQDGYKFKGGDPAKPENWEKVS